MTDNLEGDKYITLHMVWPMYLNLLELLAENVEDQINEADGVNSMRTNMKFLGRRYMTRNHTDFLPTFYHKAMTFLNPNMKKLKKMSMNDRFNFQNEIEKYITEYFSDGSETEDFQGSSNNESENILESFMSFDDSEVSPDSEISRYIHHPVLSLVDIEKWWFDHSSNFPKLFKLFLKLSCVPATSASSERTFSTGGNIVTDKRSLILPENVNNLIVARNKL